jgi:zinc transporter, ZIP family
MFQFLLRVFAYTLIPVAASGVGGVIAAIRPPGKTLKSAIQHFAAGVVFAAAALELLPKVREQPPWVAILGFAAGIIAMVALRSVTTGLERAGNRRANLGLIAATGVDVFIDGLVTGAGFAAGEETGILLTIALVLEFLFLGLSVASSLGEQASNPKIIITPPALSLLMVSGAIVSVLLLGHVPAVLLAIVLAFGAVALMYLVTEELLVEAHKGAQGPWIAAAFFLGFLIYLVIDELIVH